MPAGTILRPTSIGAFAEVGGPLLRSAPGPRWPCWRPAMNWSRLINGPARDRSAIRMKPCSPRRFRPTARRAVPLGIARDRREELREKIRRGLECDVLVLSGGVSAGTLDLVPAELTAAGVQQVFHKVELKPGKPIWFGICQSAAHRCHVFGLPGNPVSSLVCFELFVQTALRQLMGHEPARPPAIPAATPTQPPPSR